MYRAFEAPQDFESAKKHRPEGYIKIAKIVHSGGLPEAPPLPP